MFILKNTEDRGTTKLSWLDSRHSFSFGEYYDHNNMGFGPLRVINEDWIAPQEGFGMHGHKNMEIITYVLSGQLAHKDSLGHGGIITAGDVQYMSAGKGILHSEFNPSAIETAHILQIWIMPDVTGTPPAYADRRFSGADAESLRLIASAGGEDGSFTIKSDTRLSALTLTAGARLDLDLNPRRAYWLQAVDGIFRAGVHGLGAGDGLAINGEEGILTLAATEGSARALLFDLPRRGP